jgi:fructose 1,6-bisphosphatase
VSIASTGAARHIASKCARCIGHKEYRINITLSVIKADIGSIGGHIAPSRKLLDTVKASVAERSPGMEMRRQGFFGAAMLPMNELEYTGITEMLGALEGRFRVRVETGERAAA